MLLTGQRYDTFQITQYLKSLFFQKNEIKKCGAKLVAWIAKNLMLGRMVSYLFVCLAKPCSKYFFQVRAFIHFKGKITHICVP